jgi:hypothetical protein
MNILLDYDRDIAGAAIEHAAYSVRSKLNGYAYHIPPKYQLADHPANLPWTDAFRLLYGEA